MCVCGVCACVCARVCVCYMYGNMYMQCKRISVLASALLLQLPTASTRKTAALSVVA